MVIIKTVEEKIKGLKINPRYDMRCSEFAENYKKTCVEPFNGVACSFKLGYLNGYKACKAEIKKKSI